MGFCKNLATLCFNGNVWVFVARLGFCYSFGFLLFGLGVCCSFSVGHPILLLLILLDQHHQLGLLDRPILFLQMGLTMVALTAGNVHRLALTVVMASTAGNVHRLALTVVMASTAWRCSSPGFDRTARLCFNGNDLVRL
jgi:hypothetical protein